MAGTGLDVPLVGRELELDVLRTAVSSAAAGHPRAVLLAGAAGSGRSRLVRELVDGLATEPSLVLRAQCVDVGDPGLPHLVMVDLARAVRAVAGEDPEVLAALEHQPLVPSLADSPVGAFGKGRAAGGGTDASGPLRLFDAMVGLLGALGRIRGPVVLVIEDVQWVDSSSAAFLAFLLRRMTVERLAVVLTVRSDGLSGRPRVRQLVSEVARLPRVERLDLAPFTEAEVTAYLEATTEGPVRPAAVEEVMRRTGGNPYFVATLAGSGTAHGDLPPALADLLVGRVDGLSALARAVVRAAAVGTQPVPDPVLRRVIGSGDGVTDDTVDAALREAIGEGVLVARGPGYALAHELLRSAVREDLLPGERQRLHAAYGSALETGTAGTGHAAEVAHHWSEAQDPTRALAWSVRAAEDAMRVLAPAEALHQLERALELWPVVDDPETVTGLTHPALMVRAGRAAGLAGERSRAIEWSSLAVRLCDAADDPVLGVEARADLVRHLVATDSTDQVVSLGEDAVRLATDLCGGSPPSEESSRTLALAQVTHVRALLAARRTEEARALAEDAVEAAHASGATALEVDALTTAAFLDEIAGDVDGAAQRLHSAVTLARAQGELAAELRGRYTLACLHYYNGDVAGALPVLQAALGRVADSGLRWSDPGVEIRILLAVTLYAVGDLRGSIAVAASDGEGRPPDAAAARIAAVRCHAAVALGEADVEQRLVDLDASWDADPQVALVAGGCLADRLTWTGDVAGAVAVAERAQQHLDTVAGRGMYGGLWLSALGLAALADGAWVSRRSRDDVAVQAALAQGEVLLRRAAALVESGRGRPGALGPEGRAWHARAVAEHARLGGQPGVEEWRAALDAFAYGHTQGHAYEQARCRWRLAEALVAVGERDEARAAAADAAAAAEGMGAAPLRASVAAFVQSARLAPTAAGADGVLTRREREVLALVAEGLTNREIGRRLFISEKTASVHLSNLMAKLNVSSRTEAVTVAVRRGLHEVT